MSRSVTAPRRKSPLGEDLAILWHGVLGFIVQCWTVWMRGASRDA